MKVKQITKRGKEVWLVDGTVNGKRKRMFFESEAKAKRWMAAEAKDTTCQQWWLDLSNAVFAEEISINVKPPIWCRLIRCGDGRTAVRHLA